MTNKFSITDSILRARKSFSHINKDGLSNSIGDVWSIKKFLLLDYYMPAFISIVSKNNFKKIYYADPFCGSGKLAEFKDASLKKQYFPGSALIGALNASELGYTDCIFSEIEEEYVNDLNKRLDASKSIFGGRSYKAKKMDFEAAAKSILQIRKYQVAILVLIDPAAYIPIKWKTMEKLSKEIGIDIIFNFYTHRIAQNVSATKKIKAGEKNLDEFFGDSSWKKIRDGPKTSSLGEKLLELYVKKLRLASRKNVIDIGVYKKGANKLYDLIVITRSSAGAKVIKDAQSVMRNATTEAIKREFKTQITNQTRLM